MTIKGWGTRTERETLSKLLHELFEKAWRTNSTQVEEEWKDFRTRVIKTTETLRVTNKIFEHLEMTGKERALTRTVFYLFAAEGGFVNHMDFVCLLLISQGHDLFDYFRREYAVSLGSISKVDTHTKSLFLSNHGLGLFNKGLDRRLRNAIAHHDFEINDEGRVIVDRNEIDLEEKDYQIVDFLNLTNNSFKLAAKILFEE